jgi:hypothetical protein
MVVARKIFVGLAWDMGFDPVDVGPLKATRDLERLVGVMLFVRLGPLRVLSRSSPSWLMGAHDRARSYEALE